MDAIRQLQKVIRALKALVEELTGLAGQTALLVAAIYGFVRFFSK